MSVILDLPPKLLLPKPAIIRPVDQQLASAWFRAAPKALRRALLREWIAKGRLSKADAANTLVVTTHMPPALAMFMVTQLTGFGAAGDTGIGIPVAMQ